MCPHGYHHNDFMETPALGTQEVVIHLSESIMNLLCSCLCMILHTGIGISSLKPAMPYALLTKYGH